MGRLIFAFLVLLPVAVVAEPTFGMLFPDSVPPEVLAGGAVGYNWLAYVGMAGFAGMTLYLGMALIRSLKEKAEDTRESWLLLREARDVISANSRHLEKSAALLERALKVLEGCRENT